MRVLWRCLQRVLEGRRKGVGGCESDSPGQNQWRLQVSRTSAEGNWNHAADQPGQHCQNVWG